MVDGFLMKNTSEKRYSKWRILMDIRWTKQNKRSHLQKLAEETRSL